MTIIMLYLCLFFYESCNNRNDCSIKIPCLDMGNIKDMASVTDVEKVVMLNSYKHLGMTMALKAFFARQSYFLLQV